MELKNDINAQKINARQENDLVADLGTTLEEGVITKILQLWDSLLPR